MLYGVPYELAFCKADVLSIVNVAFTWLANKKPTEIERMSEPMSGFNGTIKLTYENVTFLDDKGTRGNLRCL